MTVGVLFDLASYGQADGFLGYSVGTTSCNIGTAPVNWCDNSGGCSFLTAKQHPVIAQAIYRLKAGRFEQVGMSWLKHGFVSTNSNEAPCKIGASCSSPPLGGDQLGVGCNDTYWATLNGTRPAGMRSEVNPTIGDLNPFPHTNVPFSSASPYQQEIKVAVGDMDPAQNAGAKYFSEGQYVADNDALAGNGLNNATYRQVAVGSSPDFAISFNGGLVRERSAIHAWKAEDSGVEIFNVDIPGAVVQRFEVARRATDLGAGNWHYEYAIRNMNSDRAANSFTVDFPDGTAITSTGFKDIPHHSGEPYATADWDVFVDGTGGTVSWSTDGFATDPNANALRWATMFNFWFDADAPPDNAVHTLGLFKPGPTNSVDFVMPVFADGFEAHNFVAWSQISP
ncbi:MAG: hypothetical protein R2862_12130 [Thermoanaerobaculia bacterium]